MDKPYIKFYIFRVASSWTNILISIQRIDEKWKPQSRNRWNRFWLQDSSARPVERTSIATTCGLPHRSIDRDVNVWAFERAALAFTALSTFPTSKTRYLEKGASKIFREIFLVRFINRNSKKEWGHKLHCQSDGLYIWTN